MSASKYAATTAEVDVPAQRRRGERLRVTSGVRRAVLLPLAVLLAGACGTPAAPGQSTPAPTPARWSCPIDPPGRAGTPLRAGGLLPWRPRGSLAADTELLRAAWRAWRDGDPEAPDPAGMRPLYAEQAGDRLTVVLQGRMRDGRLVAALLRGTRQRLVAEDAVTLHWPPIPQVSFWLPAAPLARRNDGERRLSTPEAELLVLAAEAIRVGWLRSTPARPRPELVELDGGRGAWRGPLADVGEVVGLQVCAGKRLLYAGLPGGLAPGFGEDPGNELTLAGPLWILDQATTGGVRWQLAARPSVRRPTGPTVCVAVRDALNLGAEPPQAETCGVQVGRRDPLWLEGAVLHAGAEPVTVAQAVAVPAASRVVFRVDGAPSRCPPARFLATRRRGWPPRRSRRPGGRSRRSPTTPAGASWAVPRSPAVTLPARTAGRRRSSATVFGCLPAAPTPWSTAPS
jgi:hypothetical protein